MCWSVMDGTATLQMPWSDILPAGHMDRDHLSTVYQALRDFEKRLLERKENDETMPVLPTPNTRVLHLDNATFNTDLANRLAHQAYPQEEVTTNG